MKWKNSEMGSVAKRLNNASGHRLCLSTLLSLYTQPTLFLCLDLCVEHPAVLAVRLPRLRPEALRDLPHPALAIHLEAIDWLVKIQIKVCNI